MTKVSENTSATGVRKEVYKSEITLDKIEDGQWQKAGTTTAQIRQVVTTKSFYPSTKVTSSFQANVFDTAEFGFTDQEFENKETRVAFLLVPKNITKEEVEKRLKLAYAEGGTIYRVLANRPILDENQQYAIAQGLSTLDVFANSQVVRYPENEATIKDGTAGTIWKDANGNVQYRKTYLWLTAKEDVDLRGDAKYPPYQSPEIKAELEGAAVLQGQTI